MQKTELQSLIRIGIGTRAWGDRLMWQYGQDYSENDLRQVYLRALREETPFFFCNEVFAEGRAESFLGAFNKENPGSFKVADKFVPRYWRMRRVDFLRALRSSLERLQLSCIDLYEIMPAQGRMKLASMAEYLAEVIDLGLVKEIGISNFTVDEAVLMVELLQRQGLRLSFYEAPYNLWDRSAERNGIVHFCRENEVTLLAQMPLGMGVLSGKYSSGTLPSGVRRTLAAPFYVPGIELLQRLLLRIGSDHGGSSAAQVALNWLLCKGTIPVVGIKNLAQADEDLSCTKWRLSIDEVGQLDEMSEKVFGQTNVFSS